MNTSVRRPLAVSMGEPAGVGTEVLFKAYQWFQEHPHAANRAFFVVDDPVRLARLTRGWHSGIQVASIDTPEAAHDAFQAGLPVLPLKNIDPAVFEAVEFGQPLVRTAPAVTQSIETAVKLALTQRAAGVVTLPIQKATLQQAGFAHPGHTEFLGALSEDTPLEDGATRGPVMMLAAGDFRTVPVTVHVPLGDVAQTLNTDMIVHTGLVVAESLRRDFGLTTPRLAVCGLNPHAGEGGLIGQEDEKVIAPAITALQERSIHAAGPFPADTMFHEAARQQYDAAIAMYHDQALIPIKTIAFHDAVNVTLGLPIIRTSPDHGTALPIAGQGIALPNSTVAAIRMATHMADQRERSRA